MSYRAVVVIEDDEMTFNVAGAGHADVLVVKAKTGIVDEEIAAEQA